MPRRARIMVPGLPFHVLQRGNNRSACFHDEADRAFYLFHLRRLLPSSGCALHAYCLMTNHVHLLLTPGEEKSCGKLMQRVGQLHSQYMNRRYGRSGTLWQGRFKSCPIEAEQYLLNCYRYIELNPVRAALASDPLDYEWSSHRANVGKVADAILTPHDTLLSALCGPAYRGFFDTPLQAEAVAEIRKATNGNYALGGEAFRRQIANATGLRSEPGKAGKPPRRDAPASGQLALLKELG